MTQNRTNEKRIRPGEAYDIPRGDYRIDPERLEAIVNAYAEYEPNVCTEDVEATLLYDWPEGEEHQHWLETAPVQEIADWLASTTFDDLDAD